MERPSIAVRPAQVGDAPQMAELLNEIIAIGGTTAHQRPFSAERMQHHYIEPSSLISCLVAEAGTGIAGFQSLVWPDDDGDPFAPGWAIIATFVRVGQTGSGVGRALFAGTRQAAAAAGVTTIDATIRADNVGGLRFYTGCGFRDYAVLTAVPLRDGRPVDRIRKRFDL